MRAPAPDQISRTRYINIVECSRGRRPSSWQSWTTSSPIYLFENQETGIRFTPEDGVLRGTADASWEVRASTSGWVVYWHGAPLCWGSRKQKSIALSSCESEIVALSEAAKEVIYLRKFVRGLVPSLPSGPTELSTDNKGARDLSYNPEHHDKSKHIARRHFFISAIWLRLRKSWFRGLVQRTTMRTSSLNHFRRRGLRCCVER